MIQTTITCYHCGDECVEEELHFDEKSFCCNGCKVVYELLNENDLCDYYTIENTPGLSPKSRSIQKFAYLDNEDVIDRLINFKDEEISIITFYLPQIHCSSCIWLLENLYKLNPSIQSSRVNFLKKEVNLNYNHNELSLRALVELLTSIGYEPELNLEKTEKKKKKVDRRLVYKIGVAGFCFGNIMLISLPEYFGLDSIKESDFTQFLAI